jgi:hypothetical protein
VSRGPAGFLRCSRTPAAAQLAEPVLSLIEGLKKCSLNFRGPLRFSATPKAPREELFFWELKGF